MVEITELNLNICRLCLKAIDDLGVNINQQKDIIEIVIPEADLNISNNCEICNDCTKFLQESFTFKSKCLEIEDSIYNFKQDNDIQINLEKILGVKDETKSAKICRTCLGYLENNAFVELHTKDGLESIFKKCFPEMVTNLTVEPVICLHCEEKLEKMFNFLTVCAKNEAKIKYYFENSNKADHNWYSFVQCELTKALEGNETFKEKENFTLSVENNEGVDVNNFSLIYDISEGKITYTEKVNDNLDSTGVKSPNTNQEINIQNILEQNEPIPQQFYSTTSNLNDTTCIGDKEVTKEKDFITHAEYNSDESEVQIVIPADNTTNEIYEISDSDEDTNKTRSMEMSRNRHRSTKKRRGFKYTSTATDGDTATDEDTDCSWVGSGNLTDSSEDEEHPRPVRKKQMTKKLLPVPAKPKTFDNSIYCKYCLFGTSRTLDMELHVLSCPFKPFLRELNETPNARNVAPLLENSSKQPENSRVNHSNCTRKEDVSKKAPVENGSSRTSRKHYRKVHGKKTISAIEVAEKVAADKERRNSNNDDCMIVETESAADTSVTKKKNYYPVFKNNLKNNLSLIEVLLCDFCDFNTRSMLQMHLHQSSHNYVLQKHVNGYKIVCYCVMCGKRFSSPKIPKKHVHHCSPKPKDLVYLFKVRNVMHCTKCYFESADVNDVKKHLEACVNIKVDMLKPGN